MKILFKKNWIKFGKNELTLQTQQTPKPDAHVPPLLPPVV